MQVTNPRDSRRSFLNQSLLALPGLAIAHLGSRAIADENQGKRFEISLHQYSLKKLFDSGELTLPDYATFAKRTLGISNIEFAAEFCGDLLGAPEKTNAIRAQSKQAGVTNRVFLCAAGKALDAVTAKERSQAVDEHLAWAKVAEGLGCEYLRVRASTNGDPKQQLTNAAVGIGKLCDALEKSSISVLVENIAGLSRDPDWLVTLMEKIGPKRIGLVADFANFEGDIYAGMQRILPYAKSVCTKSWEFDATGNETKIDFARMMKTIKESKFRGCIAIEYLGDKPVSGVRMTAELVERYGNTG